MGVVRLYQAAFPPELRIAEAALLRLTPQTSDEMGGWVFQVAVRGDEVLGFAVAYHASAIHLGYLAYLAIAETWQGRGLGTALLGAILDHWARQGASAPHWMFLEVERPELARDEKERAGRDRLITTYQALGAQWVHADFQAPPLGPGLPIVPYWILVRPLRAPDLSPASLKVGLADLYREIYGLAETHPLVKHCLASLRPD
jgi:GNAT superfamily N-acetyltransferase